VHEAVLNSGWDNLLLGAPLIGLLFFGYFRLDQVFTAKGHAGHSQRRAFSGVGEDGEPLVHDPDGRAAH
jgi:hypothetical protein